MLFRSNKIGKTTQVNAPAGFGKTILGLLWAFNSNKKIIWVCPRNTVAESVYRSITEELKFFNIDFLSTELFLSGEVKKNNILFEGDFKSDIIVTNIDNFSRHSRPFKCNSICYLPRFYSKQ